MVPVVAKIILNSFSIMKPYLTQIAIRLRALRKSRHQTQESLAAKCRQYGFPVSRNKLAKYEIGLTNIPAHFIPIAAHALNIDVTDLFPPIGIQSESPFMPQGAKTRNLTGKQIQAFRKKQKWSQRKLAAVIRKMGAPMTREIIANLETQRSRVKDYELVLFAKTFQIPLNSLFPANANFTAFRKSPVKNSDRCDKTRLIPNPLARMTRRISRFAKRFIAKPLASHLMSRLRGARLRASAFLMRVVLSRSGGLRPSSRRLGLDSKN